MANSFAKVVLATPLPQLDRLFEYRVPVDLIETVQVGSRVKASIGRSKQTLEGFVVELNDKAEYQGEIAEISEVISGAKVLTPDIYRLCRAIADRQATAIGDVLRLAIADRSVAVEKAFLASQDLWQASNPQSDSAPAANNASAGHEAAVTKTSAGHEAAVTKSKRSAMLSNPRLVAVGDKQYPSWVFEFLHRAVAQTAAGKSTILVVPDFRDQNLLIEAAEQLQIDNLVNYSTDQVKSKRYAAFLQCLTQQATVVVGSRAAVYAPSHNLGLIALWDDGDSNHWEPNSPYIHSREVALIRQSQIGCDLLLASNSRSAEVQRLVEIGYVVDETAAFDRPNIAVSDEGYRIDGLAYKTIREGLTRGPVLVQVGAKGNSVSAYCQGCSTRALCEECNGPLWLDSKGQAKCRWCNAFNLGFKCLDCGNNALRFGQAGSTRTATELARSFAGVRVVESTGETRVEKVSAKPALVIATPGAEPLAENGYAAVVLLDCQNLLGRDTLRATEDAVRLWSNAFALMANDGRGAAIGLAGELGQKVAFWQQVQLAAEELETRRELAFAPAVRLASVTAVRETLTAITEAISGLKSVRVLGPLPATEPDLLRILVRYEYSAGAELAAVLKAQVLLHGSSGLRINPKNGRAARPIRIKMDEPEVI
jgi:primosomal protein N' (replication factor Y) (superfamily II helicase)